MKTKWMKIGIVVAGAAIVAVCTLPVKKNIDTTIPTVEWKLDDKQNAKNTTVKVKGTYYSYLFRRNCFKGSIEVEGHEAPENSTLQTVYFEDGVGQLFYEDNQDFMKLTNLGFLMCSSDFSEVMVGVYSEHGGWTGEDGIVICGTASEYGEALKVARKLAKKAGKHAWMEKDGPFAE